LFRHVSPLSLFACLAFGCAAGGPSGFHDAAAPGDSSVTDSGAADSSAIDSGATDSAVTDSGDLDSGPADSGPADSGPADSGTSDSGSADTGVVDSGTADTGVVDSGEDAGTFSITLDGTVTDAEWTGAVVAHDTIATDWGVGLNHLDTLRAAVVGEQLYLAIEGQMEVTNGMIAYVDAHLGAAGGISDMNTLTDTTGNLDNAVSSTLVAPAAFKADFAFGTRVMSHSGFGFDDAFGWRDIASNIADFAWISSADAPGVCSANACETRIPLTTLGAVSGSSLGVFVRLGNAMGNDFSNQSLPEDSPTAPTTIGTWLEVPVP